MSNAPSDQLAEARAIAPIVCLPNMYNLANRRDDELIDTLAAIEVAYVPFFPFGGFTPPQSSALELVIGRSGLLVRRAALSCAAQDRDTQVGGAGWEDGHG